MFKIGYEFELSRLLSYLINKKLLLLFIKIFL